MFERFNVDIRVWLAKYKLAWLLPAIFFLWGVIGFWGDVDFVREKWTEAVSKIQWIGASPWFAWIALVGALVFNFWAINRAERRARTANELRDKAAHESSEKQSAELNQIIDKRLKVYAADLNAVFAIFRHEARAPHYDMAKEQINQRIKSVNAAVEKVSDLDPSDPEYPKAHSQARDILRRSASSMRYELPWAAQQAGVELALDFKNLSRREIQNLGETHLSIKIKDDNLAYEYSRLMAQLLHAIRTLTNTVSESDTAYKKAKRQVLGYIPNSTEQTKEILDRIDQS